MKAISTGNIYRIHDDSLRTYDALPPQVYSVRFSKTSGFFLEKHSDIEVNESKIYGVHLRKIEKVFASYTDFSRSLGVILSGAKGIGKSLFAKLLSLKAVEMNIPVVIVDEYIPGIATFIESIEQESVILFDEFDKTFTKRGYEDDVDAQATMLSLFDGMSQGKKLFVITCNKINELNDYLINRPGRFHYHFRFDYPSSAEIEEYLKDKIDEKYWSAINDVIIFANKVSLNYDCLRAIAFELNRGESFSEAIKDLNIVNVNAEKYTLTLYYENGMIAKKDNVCIDLFGDYEESVWMQENGTFYVQARFNPSHSVFDTEKMINVILPDDITLFYDDEIESEEMVKRAKESQVLYMTASRQVNKGIHYAV